MDPLYTTLNTIIHAYYMEQHSRAYLKEGRTYTQGHIPVESTHKTQDYRLTSTTKSYFQKKPDRSLSANSVSS